jgi:hypothetical protein
VIGHRIDATEDRKLVAEYLQSVRTSDAGAGQACVKP